MQYPAHMQHAEQIVGRALLHHQPRVMAGGNLLAQPFGVVLDVDRLDLVARRHHVIHRDVFQFQQIHQYPAVLARQSAGRFQHDGAQFLQPEAVALPRVRLLDMQQLQDALHEQVDEPHHRVRQRQQRREQQRRRVGDAFGKGCPDHLRRDFAEHQDQKSEQQRRREQHHFAVAEQANGQHGRQRARGGIDQIVAQQDHAQELVGLVQQRLRPHRAAHAGLGGVAQAIAVDRHHRRLGRGKKCRSEQQNGKHGKKRAGGNTIQSTSPQRRSTTSSTNWVPR